MSGAASSTMPRLVLQPTAARVAAMASRMRRPTAAAVTVNGSTDASALSAKSATVMPWPAA
jgi:hypothetical protein